LGWLFSYSPLHVIPARVILSLSKDD